MWLASTPFIMMESMPPGDSCGRRSRARTGQRARARVPTVRSACRAATHRCRPPRARQVLVVHRKLRREDQALDALGRRRPQDALRVHHVLRAQEEAPAGALASLAAVDDVEAGRQDGRVGRVPARARLSVLGAQKEETSGEDAPGAPRRHEGADRLVDGRHKRRVAQVRVVHRPERFGIDGLEKGGGMEASVSGLLSERERWATSRRTWTAKWA